MVMLVKLVLLVKIIGIVGNNGKIIGIVHYLFIEGEAAERTNNAVDLR